MKKEITYIEDLSDDLFYDIEDYINELSLEDQEDTLLDIKEMKKMNSQDFINSVHNITDIQSNIVYHGDHLNELLLKLDELYGDKNYVEVDHAYITLNDDKNYESIDEIFDKILIEMYEPINFNLFFCGIVLIKISHFSHDALMDVIELVNGLKKDSGFISRKVIFVLDISDMKRYQLKYDNCILIED